MSTYPLLCMETHARCLAFEFSRLDLREHRERTSKLQDTPLLKHMHHLLDHGYDLGHIALMELPWCHHRLEYAAVQSHLEGDGQHNLALRP